MLSCLILLSPTTYTSNLRHALYASNILRVQSRTAIATYCCRVWGDCCVMLSLSGPWCLRAFSACSGTGIFFKSVRTYCTVFYFLGQSPKTTSRYSSYHMHTENYTVTKNKVHRYGTSSSTKAKTHAVPCLWSQKGHKDFFYTLPGDH